MPDGGEHLVNAILQAALEFHDAGVCVIRANVDGTKAPMGAWAQYQVHRADREQLIEWFATGHPGIGIVTGKVSGNLEMLELEGRAVNDKLHVSARDIAIASGLGELWTTIMSGYVEQTPSGGIHILYRVTDAPIPGNTKLARRPGENGAVDVLAETRGEGGFVVTSPSSGATHPSGNPWQMIVGNAFSIPNISMEERNALHAIFKALDSMPTKEVIVQSMTKEASSERPGDDFNARAQWSEILDGWRVVYTAGGVTYWRRPGKDQGISATTGRNDGDNLFVFTTSTSFEAEKPYSKFSAFAHLHHQGDFSQASSALRRLGYGKGNSNLLETPKPLPKPTLVPDLDADHIEAPKERSSWYPRPLDLTGENSEPAPAFLARTDGHRLFYAGKINALIGESESGKTWVALLAVVQSLHLQERVMYIDFEDSGNGILGRLRSMGMEDRHFGNFLYSNPDQNLTLDEKMDLVDALLEFTPDLIVVDGVNAAMTLLNLELTSNRDATYFSQQLLKPLALSGACVITIDHVTKSKESRGSYAIGAQAKRADVTGAAIMVKVVQPFGRGMNGELELVVTKDRPGHVRAISKEAKEAGTVILKSSPASGAVSMTISSPLATIRKFRPTHFMEKISLLLEGATTPLSKTSVQKSIAGKAEIKLLAMDILLQEHFIGVENGARNSLNLISLKAYRQENDPSSGQEITIPATLERGAESA